MADYLPQRIVSLEPSITAMLYALGQQQRVVAVSPYCHRLVNVADKPQVPTTWSVTPEDVLPHEPDLVLASVPYAAETAVSLLQARLNVICLYPQRLADVYRHISWLGHMLDAGGEARQLIAGMQARLAAVAHAVASLPRPRVFVEMWPQPLMNSVAWVAELVEIAGGQFVPPEPGRQIAPDEVAAADPDVIVVAWAGVAQPDLTRVTGRDGWQQLRAVQAGRVVAVDEILLNAPGPNLVQGAEQLTAVIHPHVSL